MSGMHEVDINLYKYYINYKKVIVIAIQKIYINVKFVTKYSYNAPSVVIIWNFNPHQ